MNDRILYLNASTRSVSERGKLVGVSRYAHMRKWELHVVEKTECAQSLRRLVADVSPAGLIVDSMDDGKFPSSRLFGRIPVVYLDGDPGSCGKDAHVVFNDTAKIAQMAVHEFVGIGCSHVAYVGWFDEIYWSRWRERSFRDAAAAAGLSCATFRSRRGDRDQLGYENDLQPWIADLPSGTGILAANDCIASRVLACCRRLKLAVPGEMTLLGVDNDEARCTSESPTISSIQLDFERAGYMAGELLADVIAGTAAPGHRVKFDPLGILRRGSTRAFMRTSPRITAAMALIRERACTGLSAREVTEVIGGSRRLAEMRFREATGKSIFEEIQNTRLERARFLLAHTGKPIGSIAAFCGYRSEVALRKQFSRHVGMSMSAWRMRNANPQSVFRGVRRKAD